MAWSFESKMGVAWVIILLLLMVLAMFVEVAVGNVLPLLIPIVGYVVFGWWVFRVK